MKWFKMDCDAQENLDMRKLVDEWGWEWYGRYWAICGKVGMLVTEKRQTFALQTNNGQPFPVKLLANDLGTTVERLIDFCGFLADNRLIDDEQWKSKQCIFIPKLKERADEYTKKLLTKSRQSQEQEVEEEVDKKKIRVQSTVHEKEFEEIWQSYPNRVGKKGALRHFNASVKTQVDLANIRVALKNYLQSGNVKRGFVKNGSTWFNEWQDWVKPSNVMVSGNSNGQSQKPQATSPYDSQTKCPNCGTKHNERQCPVCQQERTLHARV